MKDMTRRWHFWVILLVIIVGLVIAFWPAPMDDAPLPETSSPDTGSTLPISESIPAAASAAAVAPATRDASVLTDEAVNAWYAGQIQDAMTLFERAIEQQPEDPRAYSYYGRLLTLMVSYDKALPLLERARDLAPDDAQSWLDLATLYERVQLLDKSWAAQAEAAELVGAQAITRDEQGRFVIEGNSLW